jgi:hypothetical protein
MEYIIRTLYSSKQDTVVLLYSEQESTSKKRENLQKLERTINHSIISKVGKTI